MSDTQQTYYDKQIERYLSQIMRAFKNFHVADGVTRNGETHIEKVPVFYGSPSRIVAAMMSGRKQHRNVKVPLISVNMVSIALDEENQLNRYHENEIGVKKQGEQMKNVVRIPGPAMRLTVEVHVYASSVSQLMELFEKIVLTFNPEVKIQKSSDVFDSDYISSLRLEGIQKNITNPLGSENRTTEMTLEFTAPIRLSYPPKFNDTLEEIRMSVFNEETDDLEGEEFIEIQVDEEDGESQE